MAILPLLAFLILIAALGGVWRARGRGPGAMQAALMLLVCAIVAVGGAWLIIRRSQGMPDESLQPTGAATHRHESAPASDRLLVTSGRST